MVDLPHVLSDRLAEHLAPVAIHNVQEVRQRRSQVAFVESKNVFQLRHILIQQKYAVEKNVGRWRDTTKQWKSEKTKIIKIDSKPCAISTHIRSVGGRIFMLSRILEREPSCLIGFRSGIFRILATISTACAT